MKKSLSMIAIALGLSAAAYAQPTPAANASAVNGQVVLFDNSTITGTIQDNIRKKGEVVIVANGKKTKYKAADISSVLIGTIRYITHNYTFYEVVSEGKNVTLLRKANEPSGVQYNGSDAISITSEGNVDDLFIRKAGAGSLQLLTKNNVKEVLGACATGFDSGKFDSESVKKLVEDCNK